MSHRGSQLDQTTQTDLLYGLKEERASGTATHSTSATLAPAATLSHSFNELSPEEFNGPRDIVAQNAATRADSSLHHQLDDLETGSDIRKASRWRYADGIAPRPYHALDQSPEWEVAEPQPLRSRWRNVLVHCWIVAAGWFTSLCLHALAIPVFLVLTVPATIPFWNAHIEGQQVAQRELLEVSAPTEIEALPSDLEVEFTSLPMLPSEVSLPDHRIDPGTAPGWLEFPSFLAMTTNAGPFDDVQGLLGNLGAGKSNTGAELGTAEFFSTKAQGNKFVFVVDCSTSMEERDRWTHACQELEDSIGRLSPEQLFYIVLFDGTVHRMFNHEERDAALFPATAQNKQRVAAWLQTVRLGPETRPFLAIKCALALQPDVVFLLSDGDFSDPTAEFLKQVNRPLDEQRRPRQQVTVHTINFHNRSLASQAMLKRIARENAGRYTFVAPK